MYLTDWRYDDDYYDMLCADRDYVSDVTASMILEPGEYSIGVYVHVGGFGFNNGGLRFLSIVVE